MFEPSHTRDWLVVEGDERRTTKTLGLRRIVWVFEPLLAVDPPVMEEIRERARRLKTAKRVLKAVRRSLSKCCTVLSMDSTIIPLWIRWVMSKNGGKDFWTLTGVSFGLKLDPLNLNKKEEEVERVETSAMVNVHVPVRLKEMLDRLVEEGVFLNVSEAVRTAIVMMLRDLAMRDENGTKELIAELVRLRSEVQLLKAKIERR
ncbi:MAG: hypothetical protein QXE92_02580 [Thermofilaceae archaeon]